MNKAAPVFIIGNPRSGTTLLRLLLNAHSQLVIPPEGGFAMWLYDRYKDWDVAMLDEYIEEVFSSMKFETWKLDKGEVSAYLKEISPSSYNEVVSHIYLFYASKQKQNIRRWGDKNNFYLNRIYDIKELFPNAYFVHIIRDGRDVACSYRELAEKEMTSRYAPNLPEDIGEIAEQWRTNNYKILKDLKKISRSISIKYEDIILDPENTLQKVCTFLGLTYEPSMLLFYKKSSKTEPEEFIEWKPKIYAALDKSSLNRYKTELTEEEILKFETDTLELLEEFEYVG